MSSSDIKRAYDSPYKTDIKLEWIRLGILPYIAEYLISIDSEGETLIRTPAAYTAWAKKLRKSMPPTVIDEELPEPFKAEQGAHQGAVLSPITYSSWHYRV